MPGARTSQTAQPVVVPAPIGGLNGRDSLSTMSPLDAVVMDNIVPGTSKCETRDGSTLSGTVGPAAVETLLVYKGGASEKMLGCSGGTIFEATLGTVLQSGRAGNQIVSTMFSNAGAQFLIGTSGSDVPFSYNGAVVANLVMTGVTGTGPTALSAVFAFKGRLYWLQSGMLGFYYLAVGAIQGAMSYFDLAQVAARGGSVTNIASFSTDGENGSSPQDYIVFITTQGEYIVYAGFDPSAAASFELVGRYYAAPPIGRRATVNYGSDLYVITDDGLLPFSAIRSPGRHEARDTALTSKLGDVLRDYSIPYGAAAGWSAIEYPGAGWLLLNFPTGVALDAHRYQYVMNTKTGMWCRFVGWDALCFAVFNRKLYYGLNSGQISEANNGADDNGPDGIAIVATAQQAWNGFEDGRGMGSANKHFHFATLLVGVVNAPLLSASLSVNYDVEMPVYFGSLDGTDDTKKCILPFSTYGEVASLTVTVSLTGSSFSWYSTKYLLTRALGLM